MAHLLFSSSWCAEVNSQQECLPGKIRLSIFLITGVCVGLPAQFWGLHVLFQHYKTGCQISDLVFMLLLSDLLVLLLNPYIATVLLLDKNCWKDETCWMLSSLWTGSLIYGLHLQHVVALEEALSLRIQSYFTDIFLRPCFIRIPLFAFICFFLCEILGVASFIFLGLPLLFIIIMISCIVTCRAPACIRDALYRSRKRSFTVFVFFICTVILYVTFSSACAVLEVFKTPYWDLLIMGVCLMSLNVIIDPLLCVLICRKHSELNKSEVNI